jgi:hypothetical protein
MAVFVTANRDAHTARRSTGHTVEICPQREALDLMPYSANATYDHYAAYTNRKAMPTIKTGY